MTNHKAALLSIDQGNWIKINDVLGYMLSKKINGIQTHIALHENSLNFKFELSFRYVKTKMKVDIYTFT